MRVAISLPDGLFEQAERLAERRGTSRSQLYATALAEFLARHEPDSVTAAIDRLVEVEGGERAAFVRAAAERRLRAVEW
ncbi:MAG: hypothetical protein HUU35_10520 [Armatimonadetes bacterium]|nr:hypothetical protein [Armatimonadota bacterium]